MNRTVMELKDFYTRAEVLENIKENGGKICCFTIKVGWNNTSYAALNNKVDDVVEDGSWFGDLDYTPLTLDNNHLILIVCASDLEDYVQEAENYFPIDN